MVVAAAPNPLENKISTFGTEGPSLRRRVLVVAVKPVLEKSNLHVCDSGLLAAEKKLVVVAKLLVAVAMTLVATATSALYSFVFPEFSLYISYHHMNTSYATSTIFITS